MQKFCIFSILGELIAHTVQDFVDFLHKGEQSYHKKGRIIGVIGPCLFSWIRRLRYPPFPRTPPAAP